MRKYILLSISSVICLLSASFIFGSDQKFTIETNGLYSSPTIVFEDNGKFGLIMYDKMPPGGGSCDVMVQRVKYIASKDKLKLVKKPLVLTTMNVLPGNGNYFNRPYMWYNSAKNSYYAVWDDSGSYNVAFSSIYYARIKRTGQVITQKKLSYVPNVDCHTPMGCAFGSLNIIVWATSIKSVSQQQQHGLWMLVANDLAGYAGPWVLIPGHYKQIGGNYIFLTNIPNAVECTACINSLAVAYSKMEYDPNTPGGIKLQAHAAKADMGGKKKTNGTATECGCGGGYVLSPDMGKPKVDTLQLSSDYSIVTSLAPDRPVSEPYSSDVKCLAFLWLFDKGPLVSRIGCRDWIVMSLEYYSDYMAGKYSFLDGFVLGVPEDEQKGPRSPQENIPNYIIGYTQQNNGRFIAQGIDATGDEEKIVGNPVKSQVVGKNVTRMVAKYHHGNALIVYTDYAGTIPSIKLYKLDLE
jgi:hypothetical protein